MLRELGFNSLYMDTFSPVASNMKHYTCFPDSTRRGDAEAGDNNQIPVALVFIPFS